MTCNCSYRLSIGWLVKNISSFYKKIPVWKVWPKYAKIVRIISQNLSSVIINKREEREKERKAKACEFEVKKGLSFFYLHLKSNLADVFFAKMIFTSSRSKKLRHSIPGIEIGRKKVFAVGKTIWFLLFCFLRGVTSPETSIIFNNFESKRLKIVEIFVVCYVLYARTLFVFLFLTYS